jgi:NinB protein
MTTETIYREFILRSPSVWQVVSAFVKEHAKACIEAGSPLRIIFTTEEQLRNREQNKRYFGFLIKHIAAQAWVNDKQFSKEAWHEYFAKEYGRMKEVILPGGEVIQRRVSTAEYTVGEFSKYMNEVTAYACTELGVRFPEEREP